MPKPRLLFLVNEIDRLLGDVVEVTAPAHGYEAQVKEKLTAIDAHIDELRESLWPKEGT